MPRACAFLAISRSFKGIFSTRTLPNSSILRQVIREWTQDIDINSHFSLMVCVVSSKRLVPRALNTSTAFCKRSRFLSKVSIYLVNSFIHRWNFSIFTELRWVMKTSQRVVHHLISFAVSFASSTMISKGLLESYASFAPSNLVKMVASVNAHSRGLVLTTETTARRPSYAQRDRAIFHRCPYMFRKHRAFLSTPSEGLFLMISNDLNPLHREPTIDCRVETCHRF